MQTSNKAHHKLMNVIVLTYQMYRLYSEIWGKEGGNYKMVNVIDYAIFKNNRFK